MSAWKQQKPLMSLEHGQKGSGEYGEGSLAGVNDKSVTEQNTDRSVPE